MSNINDQAQVIRNETVKKANSADRLGKILEDIGNKLNLFKPESPYSNDQVSSFRGTGNVSLHSIVPTSHPASSDTAPTICFICDNHRKENIEQHDKPTPFPGYQNLFDQRSVKYGVSVTSTGYSNNFMTVQELLDFQAAGFELMSHIYYTTEGTLSERQNHTEEEAYDLLLARKKHHIDLGFDVKNANWFQGQSTVAYRSAVRKLYRSVRRGSGNYNPVPIDQYNYATYQFFELHVDYNATIAWVDEIITRKELGVISWHGSNADMFEKYDDDGNIDANGEYGWQKLMKVVDYIKSRPGYGTQGGISIKTPDKAMDIFENALEIGDRSLGRFFHVSKTGRVNKEGLNVTDIEDKIKISDPNTKVGHWAGSTSTATDFTYFGRQAGYGASGNGLFFAGNNAGFNAAGDFTVSVGRNSGNGSSGSNGVYIGVSAGQNNDQDNSIYIGFNAGLDSSADRGVGVGAAAMRNSSSRFGIGIGYSAGFGSSGNNSIVLGYEAGKDNTIHNRFLVEQRIINTTPLIDGDFINGGLAIGAPTVATKLADSRIGANRFTFYLDETANKLHVRVKYADGTTIKEGEVALV